MDSTKLSDSSGPIRIGALALRSGKSIRALHLYEQMGLLPAAQRTEGGFRLFTPDAPLRIEWIDALQSLGLSLAEIREFDHEFGARLSGPHAATLARDRFEAELLETRKAIQRLGRLETELTAALEYLEACKQCIPPLPSTACPECEMPRERHEKPILLKGLYAKPGPALAGATAGRSATSSRSALRLAHQKRRSRKGGA